jgi:hypothetical protein
MNYGYHASLWLKWQQRSAEAKRIAAHQAAVRPFLRPVQQQIPLRLTTPK